MSDLQFESMSDQELVEALGDCEGINESGEVLAMLSRESIEVLCRHFLDNDAGVAANRQRRRAYVSTSPRERVEAQKRRTA